GGVATFSGLSLDRVGSGYALRATYASLVANSAAFNVTPGSATQLAFTVQPSSAASAAAIAPPVQITARDAQGNDATGYTGQVTVALGNNPTGATLGGTRTVPAVAGVAAFP